MKLIGESHWIFLGLAGVAHVLETCVRMKENMSECTELLEKIVQLAKDVKDFPIPQHEIVRKAVAVIVEGTVMCSDHIARRRASRFWSASKVEAQLQKTSDSIKDMRDSLQYTLATHIVRQTTTRLPEQSPKLLDFEPVGIEQQVSQIKEMLDIEGNDPAIAVVVCGFGGIGKSTVAAAAIQELALTSLGFKFCRIIIDDKTPDKISHIKQLQKDIIFDFGGQKLDPSNPNEGRRKLQEVMKKNCCFLYIDNVVDINYVEQLLPKQLSEGNQKLRIIITSREGRLQRVLNVKKCLEYHVNILSTDASKNFLKKTILGDENKSDIDFDEEQLINEVAEGCKGVPILLSRIGNYLKDDREQSSYNTALEALKKANFEDYRNGNEDDVSEILLFVYKNMDDEAQQAFLDICIYFHGWDRRRVGHIVGIAKLKTLEKKMLVNKSESDDDKVIVHDILRTMGINESKETRFTNYKELSELVAEEDASKLKNVKGISLLPSYPDDIALKSKDLNVMHGSLRVLILGDRVKLNGPVCDKPFKNLRYLQLDGNEAMFPFKDASKLEKLTGFSNRSKAGRDLALLPPKLKFVYHELEFHDAFASLPLQNLTSLEDFTVKLNYYDVRLPEGLEFPASLVNLSLYRCPGVPKRFGHLSALEKLTLDSCDWEVLPQGFGQLARLQYLRLSDCPKLTSFSDGFGSFRVLKELDMSNCFNLKELPKDIGALSSLQALNFSKCKSLENVPSDLVKLTSLKELDMSYCKKLKELPKDIGALSSLQALNLSGCTSLENVPSDLVKLTSLKELDTSYCENLKDLPEEMGGLSSLLKLNFYDCKNLQRLPESFASLSIESLDLSNLDSLEELPQSIGNLPCLTSLSIESCNLLTSLPNSFVQLQQLETLEICNCLRFGALPSDFGNLPCLTSLSIKSCNLLTSLPNSFVQLQQLETLEICNCLRFGALPSDFGRLSSLREMTVKSCPILKELPSGFQALPSLEKLKISTCFQLKTLPDEIETLVSLIEIKIMYCPNLNGPAMDRLVKLQKCDYVNISGSTKLIDRWEEMQEEEECPMFVSTSSEDREDEVEREERFHQRVRVGLLGGEDEDEDEEDGWWLIELDTSRDALIDHSSMLFDKNTTLVLILFNCSVEEWHREYLQTFVEVGNERATVSSEGQLTIVCVVDRYEKEESIRQILTWLPKGSSVIPSSSPYYFPRFRGTCEHCAVGCWVADVQANNEGNSHVSDFERIYIEPEEMGWK